MDTKTRNTKCNRSKHDKQKSCMTGGACMTGRGICRKNSVNINFSNFEVNMSNVIPG